MKKSLQFILLIAFFAINFTAKSQVKVFNLKDTYFNCGSRNFILEFKFLNDSLDFINFSGNFIVEPESATNGQGYVVISKNLAQLRIDELTESVKVKFYNNYSIDTLTDEIKYNFIQSFDVIKIDTLPKPTITQVGNKLVSNIEGPHRWYFGPSFTNRFEDTPNNVYTPKMQGVYYVTLINPEYECVSAESKGFEYIINSVEDDLNQSNSQKYNINENTITFFDVDEIAGATETNSVEIYNILGEKLELNLSNISKNNNSISLQFDNNFNSLNAGMYLIVLKDNNNTLHKFTFVK